ncbi:MAG: hypothetical protein E5W82_08785 [Mesorhizobium sp.]|nr:MAG: hypothetical protein E5W82_08785 [Mesorhizobium sp.]
MLLTALEDPQAPSASRWRSASMPSVPPDDALTCLAEQKDDRFNATGLLREAEEMTLFSQDIDDKTEAMVDEFVLSIGSDELPARAVKEAMMSKLTSALAAGRARDAMLVGLVNRSISFCCY